MVASIGKIASPSQSVAYFERDGYYAKDDASHLEASAWVGRGVETLGLSGPFAPECFRSVLEGEVPGGRRLGRGEIGGKIVHRPGCDVTLSASKSVSLMALAGGDECIVEAHDSAVTATLDCIEKTRSRRGCATLRLARWSARAARGWSRRPSGMTRRGTSTRSFTPMPPSPPGPA